MSVRYAHTGDLLVEEREPRALVGADVKSVGSVEQVADKLLLVRDWVGRPCPEWNAWNEDERSSCAEPGCGHCRAHKHHVIPLPPEDEQLDLVDRMSHHCQTQRPLGELELLCA